MMSIRSVSTENIHEDAQFAGGSDDPSVRAVARKALEFIPDGARVGLGSGRAASLFITLLGERLRDGLRVSGVPTSLASTRWARDAGIPLSELGVGGPLDVTVDGADEVAPNLDLVKGWGGALVRERIVAAASQRQVILVGTEKLVRTLGEHGRIPVEVIPFAEWLVLRELKALGLTPTIRPSEQKIAPYFTDNGNLIIDCAVSTPLTTGAAARALEVAVRAIPGVVDTGLFLGTADVVLIGHADGRVETRHRETQDNTKT